MRIVIAKSTLRVPPTYFAVQHALALARVHDVRIVTGVAAVADAEVEEALDIVEVVPRRGGTFRQREVQLPLVGRAFRAAIRAHAPDLVHQQFATWSGPARSASSSLGVPLVATVHGADVFAALRPLSAVPLRGRPMLAWHQRNVAATFAAAGRVLAVSRYLADHAIRAGMAAERLEVHYQGVDHEFFAPSAGGSSSGEPVVLFVGAMSESKGVRDLIEASLAAMRTTPHRLRLVGGGPLDSVVRAAALEHRHIEQVGALDRAGVRRELQAAALLALPAQEHAGAREAAGLVLLEAQACGTPVVAYDSGGTSEMLDDEITGLLVPEGDRARLGQAISAVLGSPDRERMGRAARRFVVEQRSVAGAARELDTIYRELAGTG